MLTQPSEAPSLRGCETKAVLLKQLRLIQAEDIQRVAKEPLPIIKFRSMPKAGYVYPQDEDWVKADVSAKIKQLLHLIHMAQRAPHLATHIINTIPIPIPINLQFLLSSPKTSSSNHIFNPHESNFTFYLLAPRYRHL
jgi:hypothetical protein